MLKKLRLLLFGKRALGVVHIEEMDELLGDNDTVDVTSFLQNRVRGDRLEIKDDAGKVIMRIPDPKEFPEVWDDVL